MKKKIIIFIVVICLLIIFNIINKGETIKEVSIGIEETSKEKQESDNVKFDIKGYVKNPGVYKIANDARISDALILAGGLIDGANTRYTNLSKIITNEMVIIIYGNEEIDKMFEEEIILTCPPITTKCPDGQQVEKLININTASLDELVTIPGIGESKAIDIVDFRKNNKFNRIEDIMDVKGIGVGIFEKLKNYITV